MEESQPISDRQLLVRRIGLAGGPMLFLLCLILPLPTFEGVEPDTAVRVTLGLACWMAAWWMTEALPLAATSLLPLAVLPVAGVIPANGIASFYFSDIVALFLGGFCLALAMQKSGLHRRIATRVLRLSGASPRRVVLGFVGASALMSMWVSNTATTLMLIPVVVTVVDEALPREGRSAAQKAFATACLLGVAFGASLGGIGTTIGTPPNAYLQGFFNQHYATEIAAGTLREITFGRWMMIGLPIVLIVVPLCWLLLIRISPGVPTQVEGFSRAEALERLKQDGGPSTDQWLVMLIFFTAAAAWITHAPIRLGEWTLPLTGWDLWLTFGGTTSFVTDGTIAITAAIALFVLPNFLKKGEHLLSWEYAGPRLPWGALLLFGGGLALAGAFEVGGLNAYLKAVFGTLAGMPIWLLVLLVVVLVTLLSEFASNTAAAAMAIPVLASLAAAVGVDPMPLLMAAALGASCGYAMPVATPPNTIVYATGKLEVSSMVRAGLILDVIVIAVVYLAVQLLVRTVF